MAVVTTQTLLDEGIKKLEEAGISDARVDAFIFLEEACQVSHSMFLMDRDRLVSSEQEENYFEMIRRRALHEPCQYITGSTEFCGYKILVTPDVLIPRQDTEVLVEKVREQIDEKKLCQNAEVSAGKSTDGDAPKARIHLLDMCTGSGCIAIALKKMLPEIMVTASDISDAALKVAEKNASINECDIELINSNLFEKFDDRAFDIIVSNPPYVAETEYQILMPEVKLHEPKLALTAGSAGLDIYERLIPDAFVHLKTDGLFAVEIGCAQAETVSKLFKNSGFKQIEVIKDIAGLNRVVMGKK